MWNVNYDDCRPRVMFSVSAVTRVGGSRSRCGNEASAVNTDEETELGSVPEMAGRMEKRWMDMDACCFVMSSTNLWCFHF